MSKSNVAAVSDDDHPPVDGPALQPPKAKKQRITVKLPKSSVESRCPCDPAGRLADILAGARLAVGTLERKKTVSLSDLQAFEDKLNKMQVWAAVCVPCIISLPASVSVTVQHNFWKTHLC